MQIGRHAGTAYQSIPLSYRTWALSVVEEEGDKAVSPELLRFSTWARLQERSAAASARSTLVQERGLEMAAAAATGWLPIEHVQVRPIEPVPVRPIENVQVYPIEVSEDDDAVMVIPDS
eukprot:5785768-Amphidinium_carterae.3